MITSSTTTRDRDGHAVRSTVTETNTLRTLLTTQLRTFDIALVHDGILVDIRDDDGTVALTGEMRSLDIDGVAVETSVARSVHNEGGRWDWELQFRLPGAAGPFGDPARDLYVVVRGRRHEIPQSLRREGIEAYWSGRESLLDDLA